MRDDEDGFGVFLHWGPITVLVITTIISLTTSKWWPSENSSANSAHFAFFLLINLLSVYNFALAAQVGPGLVPRRWHPTHHREAAFLQFCKRCDGYKAPRSHHCRRCDRCVKKMDHHCPWINGCVGWANHAHFVYFLFFYLLCNLHAAVVIGCGIYQFIAEGNRGTQVQRLARNNLCMLLFGIVNVAVACGIVLCMLKLLYMHLGGILRNKTDIEHWIVQKAVARRRMQNKLKAFVYPYDLGWYSNLGQVFNADSQLRGRGIEWPVCKGCDQYTLTREQLAQKLEKSGRTRIYQCIKHASGHWLPIWSGGLMATLCMPWTDEPRISLQPSDTVRVTRIHDHWLYGERILRPSDGRPRRKEGPIRGWFPSKCAVDITHAKDSAESGEPRKATRNADEEKLRTGQQKSGKLNQD